MLPCVCPSCFYKNDLSAFLNSADWSHFTALLIRYDGSVRQVVAYLSKFRANTKRVIPAEKSLHLLKELEDVIEAGEFIRNKMKYPLNRASVMEGIHRINLMENLKLPLKSHALLYEILTGIPPVTGILPAAKQSAGRQSMYNVETNNKTAAKNFLNRS